jgi:hypothetical protein
MSEAVYKQPLLAFLFLLNIFVYLVSVLLNQTLFKITPLSSALLIKEFIILAILESK